MAVQIPDPGTGNGQTGDNEYVFRKKVKDNFSDQTNAAGRLVGKSAGQVPLSEMVKELAYGTLVLGMPEGSVADFPNGVIFANAGVTDKPVGEVYQTIHTFQGYNSSKFQISAPYIGNMTKFYIRGREFNPTTPAEYKAWGLIYTSSNTTKDANGFLKGASPIVKVHADKVVLNEEAEQQNVTFKKNGIGDYTITTESGLSTDGWYIELPKDMNGNPKVAVTLSEVEGVITLKSYKRIFSMETFTFEPDLSSPLDIPDTRWIDLRLNEIPVENLDDTQMEV